MIRLLHAEYIYKIFCMLGAAVAPAGPPGSAVARSRQKECSISPNREKHTAKPTEPKTRVADQKSTTSNIFNSNTGDSTSEQDSAFKKGNDVVTPSPYDPKSRT